MNSIVRYFHSDLPDPALKILAQTSGQLIPLYTTTKSRLLLTRLFEEMIRKYRERIIKVILQALDVQTRVIYKVHPQ